MKSCSIFKRILLTGDVSLNIPDIARQPKPGRFAMELSVQARCAPKLCYYVINSWSLVLGCSEVNCPTGARTEAGNCGCCNLQRHAWREVALLRQTVQADWGPSILNKAVPTKCKYQRGWPTSQELQSRTRAARAVPKSNRSQTGCPHKYRESGLLRAKYVPPLSPPNFLPVPRSDPWTASSPGARSSAPPSSRLETGVDHRLYLVWARKGVQSDRY